MKINILQVFGSSVLLVATLMLLLSKLDRINDSAFWEVASLGVICSIAFWQITDWLDSIKNTILKEWLKQT